MCEDGFPPLTCENTSKLIRCLGIHLHSLKPIQCCRVRVIQLCHVRRQNLHVALTTISRHHRPTNLDVDGVIIYNENGLWDKRRRQIHMCALPQYSLNVRLQDCWSSIWFREWETVVKGLVYHHRTEEVTRGGD